MAGYVNHIDCLLEMSMMEDGSVDLIVTDLPFGVVNRPDSGLRNLNKGQADVQRFDVQHLAEEFDRLCRGSIYAFCSSGQFSTFDLHWVARGYTRRSLIWEKTNPSPLNGQRVWLSGIEHITFCRKPGAVFNGHCRNTVLRHPCGVNENHPTEKPIPLLMDLIATSSKPGDLVFDPFAGSGSTGVAAVRLGRRFVGCEIDPAFVAIANERLAAETRGQDLKSYREGQEVLFSGEAK